MTDVCMPATGASATTDADADADADANSTNNAATGSDSDFAATGRQLAAYSTESGWQGEVFHFVLERQHALRLTSIDRPVRGTLTTENLLAIYDGGDDASFNANATATCIARLAEQTDETEQNPEVDTTGNATDDEPADGLFAGTTPEEVARLELEALLCNRRGEAGAPVPTPEWCDRLVTECRGVQAGARLMGARPEVLYESATVAALVNLRAGEPERWEHLRTRLTGIRRVRIGALIDLMDRADDDEGAAEEEAARQTRHQHALTATSADLANGGASWFQRNLRLEIIAYHATNIRLALRFMDIAPRWNAFAQEVEIAGARLENATAERLMVGISDKFGFTTTKDMLHAVLGTVAWESSYHPVLEMLDGLVWDGVSRIDTWLIDYAGAPDTPLVRALCRLFLRALIRRLRQPGAKYDEMMVLESPPGYGKSTMLRLLALKDEWFCDSLPLGADDKIVIERTKGKWLVEFSELRGQSGREAEHIKAFLSRQEDVAREAFGRITSRRQRTWVGFGTTNESLYLSDSTGNRRYLPVEVRRVRLDEFKAVVHQLWAEAVADEAAGESLQLPRSLWADAAEQQEGRRSADPWEAAIQEGLEEGGVTAGCATSQEWLAALGVPLERQHRGHQNKLGAAMVASGLEHIRWRENVEGREVRRRGYAIGAVEAGRPRLEVTALGLHRLEVKVKSVSSDDQEEWAF